MYLFTSLQPGGSQFEAVLKMLAAGQLNSLKFSHVWIVLRHVQWQLCAIFSSHVWAQQPEEMLGR